MKNCSEISESISLYVDNRLSSQELAEFEEHIMNCRQCKSEFDEMVRMAEICRNVPEVEIPADFECKLHEKLLIEKAKQDGSGKALWLRNRYVRIAASIAAVLLTVFAARAYVSDYFLTHSRLDAESNERYLQSENIQASTLRNKSSDVEQGKADTGNQGKADAADKMKTAEQNQERVTAESQQKDNAENQKKTDAKSQDKAAEQNKMKTPAISQQKDSAQNRDTAAGKDTGAGTGSNRTSSMTGRQNDTGGKSVASDESPVYGGSGSGQASKKQPGYENDSSGTGNAGIKSDVPPLPEGESLQKSGTDRSSTNGGSFRTAYTTAGIKRNTDIIIKSAEPEKVLAEIKSITANFDVELSGVQDITEPDKNPDKAVGTESAEDKIKSIVPDKTDEANSAGIKSISPEKTDSTGMENSAENGIKTAEAVIDTGNNRSADGTLVLKIAFTQFGRFKDTLLEIYDRMNVQVGDVMEVDVNASMKMLNTEINRLNIEIQSIESTNITHPGELEKLKIERNNLKAEYDGLLKSTKYILVHITVESTEK